LTDLYYLLSPPPPPKDDAYLRTMNPGPIRYAVTGVVAHERICPLLPEDWMNTTDHPEIQPDFLWENAPRRDTKAYRDIVKVYSHLPNGSNLLDSKWALGRLFSNVCTTTDSDSKLVGALETHCFRGVEGFHTFAIKVGLRNKEEEEEGTSLDSNKEKVDSSSSTENIHSYPDIMDQDMDLSLAPDPNYLRPKNLWVVKDAMANGAGGIWVVGPENVSKFLTTTPTTTPTTSTTDSPSSTPLFPEHKYVAQRYVWPPILYGGRKCHVRVYALFTCDGRAFVHHRAFLHVANDPFTTTYDSHQTGSFQDSIHITNCCANSHDEMKFAGEILADFEESQYNTQRDGKTVVPLAKFFPSVSKSIAFLAQQAFPFLQGGQANHGFEYLGIDFMLSYNDNTDPMAYILEINAPPSQDSATGLPHAENLHNEVLQDLITLWVLPHVTNNNNIENPGGWRCIHGHGRRKTLEDEEEKEPIIPSKAAIINMIRWNMFEKKAQKRDDDTTTTTVVVSAPNMDMNGTEKKKGTMTMCGVDPSWVSTFARTQFPFFSSSSDDTTTSLFPPSQVFFENAGGSQVAQSVIDAMSQSLRFRHRSKIGTKSKRLARQCLRKILGANEDDAILLGPNATTIIASAADHYVRLGLLKEGDEVVVSTENHTANFIPWIRAAKTCGAIVKYWTPFSHNQEEDSSQRSKDLKDVLTTRTRIVAIPHASNVLGQIRDLQSLTTLIKNMTKNYGHVVVDGVAAVPHCFADLKNHVGVDWYVISCHKVFGPHLGAMFGRRRVIQEFISESSTGLEEDSTALYNLLESGTVNYEGCAGVIGLGQYFASLSSFTLSSPPQPTTTMKDDVTCVYSGSVSSDGGAATGIMSPSERSSWTSSPSSLEEYSLTVEQVKEAYRRIRFAEVPLVEALLQGLQKSKHVQILEAIPGMSTTVTTTLARLPTVSFIHSKISSPMIVSVCEAKGISCRCSSFLCTSQLATDFGFDHSEGIVRTSLVHYNTLSEIDTLLQVLEGLDNWF